MHLKRMENVFLNGLNLIRDGVLIIDKSFYIKFANTSALEYLGYESLAGEHCYVLMSYMVAKIHDKLDKNKPLSMGFRSIPIIHQCGSVSNVLANLTEKEDMYFFVLYLNSNSVSSKVYTEVREDHSFSSLTNLESESNLK